MKTTDPIITVSATYKVSAEELWEIISNPKLMREWYFEALEDFKSEPGFSTAFCIEHNDKTFTHQWTILTAQPHEILAYDWSYKEYKGLGLVTFKLDEQGDETTLTLTNNVLEDFPDDMEEFTRESCIAGWNYFIKERLAKYLSDG